jgi:hypothetical protein
MAQPRRFFNMAKLKHRAGGSKPAAESPAPQPAAPFEPLPPPKRNKIMLVAAIGLVAAWIAFLGLLVLIN